MKKFIFMTAFAATMGLMTSCSEDELTSPSSVDNNTIAFATKSNKAMTRSASTLTELEKFTVSANNADNSIFFADQLFTYDMSASIFKSATSYYWPLGGSLSFYAINEPGTKSLNGSNIPSYSYENWAGETDLVAATVLSGNKTVPYPLTFKHVTSQVYVTAEAINKTEDLTYKLISVKMSTPSTGTYSFADATGGQGSWVIDKDKTSEYSFAEGMPIEIDKNGRANPSDVYWNILPVTDGTIEFSIEYQVYQNNKMIADFTGVTAKKAKALSPQLEMGKKYIYNFLMSRGTDDADDVLSFTTTIIGWDSETNLDIYSQTLNGHEYVEIGGKKWATMNLGSTSVAGNPATCSGDYYAWGETKPRYTDKSWDSSSSTWVFSGWNDEFSSGYASDTPLSPNYTETTLDAEHDAATSNWGASWRTPTADDFKQLFLACSDDYSILMTPSTLISSNPTSGVYLLSATQTYLPEYSGTTGLLFVDKADTSNRLFFPYAGRVLDKTCSMANGDYWTSSIDDTRNYYANEVHFYFSKIMPAGVSWHHAGFPIRPISD